MVLENQRREYTFAKLRRDNLLDSPFEQFQLWLQQAIDSDLPDPTAMSVATVSRDGKPWQRMVLLKGFSEKGFIFYTNLGSRKAREIEENPNVSLHFPWLSLDRQVIIGGRAEKLPRRTVLSYFLSRPFESQLGAVVSKQSRKLGSRQLLEAEFKRLKDKFADGKVPLPDFWGGYLVVPEEFEFWQGGDRRLHDRFQYLREKDGWEINRLSP